jgi:Kef-type K+ transport system membrane component KefB
VPTEHQLLVFWCQILALVLAARVLGGLARGFGQPAVIGELAAGVLLGPSVLGNFAPGAHAWLFPADPVQRGLLSGLAWVGVFMLLILTGMETDLALVRRLGRAAARVAVGSLLVPLAAGVALGFWLPANFVGESTTRATFALLMGAALALSALPVIAKVLQDLDLMRRNVAQLMISVAMIDDVVGWILLGAASGLAGSGSIDPVRLATTIGGLALFIAAAMTVGQRAVDVLFRWLRERRAELATLLTATLVVAIASGATTHALGLEAVFGAFIAGIVLGNSRFHDAETVSPLDALTRAFFAPLFFATAGLRTDLTLLREPEVAFWAAVAFALASLSKFVGGFLGARAAGLPRREGMALAVGLNARGAVEIVLATVGLTIGVLNARSYTVVVLIALATSMIAPPLLRALLHGWSGSEEEQARLERERVLGSSLLVRAERLLLPTHGGPNSVLAARLVDAAWPEGVGASVLAVGADVPEGDVAEVRAAFARRPVNYEKAGGEPLPAILAQARLGYGAIAVGATDRRAAGALVSPFVDELLAASPLPVVMVRRDARLDPAAPLSFRRVLVPAAGKPTGRAAQEVAFRLARQLGARALIAHVVTLPSPRRALSIFRREDDERHAAAEEVAEQVVLEASELAAQLGVPAEAEIRLDASAPEALLALARQHAVDLLVLGANIRSFSGRPFLGHGVEYLLEKCECTVVVVTLPPGWGGPGRWS